MILLRCACFGAAAGLLYDLFQALRLHFRWKKRGTALADGLFWLTVLPGFLLFFLHATDGRLRFYLLLGLAGGAFAYRRTLSPAVVWLLKKILAGVSWLTGQIARALLWTFSFPRGQ